MNPEPPDLIGLVVALLTLIGSKGLADMLGPYVAIIVAASVAAAWALSGVEEEMGGWKSLRFFLIRILTAVIFTVSISMQLHHLSTLPMQLLLVPVAFAIGLIKNVTDLRGLITDGWNFFKMKVYAVLGKGASDGK